MVGPFTGRYRWLSNFWPCEITLQGVTYPSVEHAYQAAKSSDPVYRRKVLAAKKPGEAKRLGKLIILPDGWEDQKRDVMSSLLWQKFRDKQLRDKLLATGEENLVEWNTWGDGYWGMCPSNRRDYGWPVGENWLGRLLMRVREQLRLEAAWGQQ